MSIIAAGDGLFPRLAKLIGRDDLLEDARSSTLKARCEHGDEINAIVAEWCRRHTAAEIEELCLEADVPFARTYTVKDICDDPHIQDRFSRTPGSIRRGAPQLGEHNQEVYGGLLGKNAAEIEDLRQKKII